MTRLLLMAFSAVLLMSWVPVIIKWIQVNPATIGIVRLAIACFGLLLISRLSKHKVLCQAKDLRWLALLGLIFALHWYSYFLSIKLASASLAAIGVATFGIHLLLLASFFNREKIKASDFLAVSLALTGLFLASPKAAFSFNEFQGFLLAILSGFLYACLPLINQRIQHLSTQTRAIGQFGFALLGFLLLWPETNFDLKPTDWQGLVILGVICTLIAHTLWIKVSTELPANFTAVIYYCYVPIAMLLSYLMLNESMSWQKLLGAGLVISANLIVVALHKKST